MHVIKIKKTVNAQRDETPDISVENPNVGKTTAAHRLQKIPLYERNTMSKEKHRGNDLLSSSLSPHAAVTTRRQQPLSLSLCLSHALYNYSYNNATTPIPRNCALSHIYTHMIFRHIYISVLPIGRYRSGLVLR